jgi:MEMO1 family protein
MIKFGAITPHPPILIDGIGTDKDRQKVEKTIEAMEGLALRIKKEKIDTVFLISPHALSFEDTFLINCGLKLEGDLFDFGLSRKYFFQNDFSILDKIESCLIKKEDSKIKVALDDFKLDHGSIIPLHFLSNNNDFKLVLSSFSFLDFRAHFDYGLLLFKILMESKKRIAVIASGDLSHALTPDAPAGYDKSGKIFDEKLIELLMKKEIEDLFSIDLELVYRAKECGFRPILILLGIFNALDYDFKKLSYEGPFGVGYLTGIFDLKKS